MNDDTRLYHESDWATRRWDWFNRGKLVEPKSFCQFWRTVLLYVTIKQLLTPARLVGRPAVRGVIAVGESMDTFEQRHRTGLKVFALGLLAIYFGGVAILILALAFTASSFWTSVAIGSVVGTGFFGFAIYGFVKIGAVRLVWEAAVAAKHGVCPPIKIVRVPE